MIPNDPIDNAIREGEAPIKTRRSMPQDRSGLRIFLRLAGALIASTALLLISWLITMRIDRRNDLDPNGNPRITTTKIIELLENADLAQVGSAHSQMIVIRTKDGKTYNGEYKCREAERYQHIDDVGNLVLQIVRDKRGLKDVSISME